MRRVDVEVWAYSKAHRAWPKLFREIDDQPPPYTRYGDEVSGKSVASPPHIATARRCAKRSEAKRKPLIYNAATAIRSTVSGGEIAFGT